MNEQLRKQIVARAAFCRKEAEKAQAQMYSHLGAAQACDQMLADFDKAEADAAAAEPKADAKE